MLIIVAFFKAREGAKFYIYSTEPSWKKSCLNNPLLHYMTGLSDLDLRGLEDSRRVRIFSGSWFCKAQACVVKASYDKDSKCISLLGWLPVGARHTPGCCATSKQLSLSSLPIVRRLVGFFPHSAPIDRWALEGIWKWKAFMSAVNRVNSVWQLWAGDIDLYWHNPLFCCRITKWKHPGLFCRFQ